MTSVSLGDLIAWGIPAYKVCTLDDEAWERLVKKKLNKEDTGPNAKWHWNSKLPRFTKKRKKK